MVDAVIQGFLESHPEELVNGQLRVCVGGGAGFIGSHIAKKFKELVWAVRYSMGIHEVTGFFFV